MNNTNPNTNNKLFKVVAHFNNGKSVSFDNITTDSTNNNFIILYQNNEAPIIIPYRNVMYMEYIFEKGGTI